MKLSVVIPVLNEVKRIDQALATLLALPGIDEVIVVDGGSTDGTAEMLQTRSDIVFLAAARGRSLQQNAGARRASGDTLLFLHADATLPASTRDVVDEVLAKPGVVAGAFRVRHVPDAWRGQKRRLLLHLADIRSRYSKLPYGDQAIFVRAKTFWQVGGFPEIALMEDLALSRTLSRLGRIAVANAIVQVSGRRFESQTVVQTLWVNIFPAMYALGVPPRFLARLYGDPR